MFVPVLAMSASGVCIALAVAFAVVYVGVLAWKRWKPTTLWFRASAPAPLAGDHAENVAAMDAVRVLQLAMADMGKRDVQYHLGVVNSVLLDSYEPAAAINDCLHHVLQYASMTGNADLAKHVTQAIAIVVQPGK